MKALLIVLCIIFIAKSQVVDSIDSVTPVKLDSLVAIKSQISNQIMLDSIRAIVQAIKPLESIKVPEAIKEIKDSYENIYIEMKNIKEKYRVVRSIDITNKLYLKKAVSLKNEADSCLNAWRENYPVAARVEKGKKVLIGVGVSEIGTGLLGTLLTIADANGKTNYSFKIDKQTYKGSFENEWTFFHTMALFLSLGFVVSGIIIVNF